MSLQPEIRSRGIRRQDPFEEMVYTDGGEMESYFIQNIRVEFSSTLVHSRKLSIRVMVGNGHRKGKTGG